MTIFHAEVIRLHDRTRLRGNLGDRGEVDPMLLQRLTAVGADRLGQLDLDGGSGPLVGPWQGAEGEVPLTGLAAGPFGLGLALAFGEGSGLSLRVARLLLQLDLQGGVLGPQGCDLGPELLDTSFQGGKLGEHLSDERQECLFPQSCEFGERGHDTDL